MELVKKDFGYEGYSKRRPNKAPHLSAIPLRSMTAGELCRWPEGIMSKMLVPTSGPDDRKCFLADPEEHWRSGYSANVLAHCWEESAGSWLCPKSSVNYPPDNK